MSRDRAGGSSPPPRVLVPEGELSAVGQELAIARSEARHLRTVLRRNAGDELLLIDGCGNQARAVIHTTAGGVGVRLLALEREPPPPGPGALLALGVLHSQAMDWAIQKSVELGVRRLTPLLTRRSQLGRRAACGRRDHWQRVAAQSLKQCGRLWALHVDQPISFEEFLADCDAETTGLADPDGTWYLERRGMWAPTILLVGPEGGFAETEREAARAAGVRRVSFGRHTLRADTAAVVGAAWVAGMAARERGSDD